MLIISKDRETFVLQRQPLIIAPNIRRSCYNGKVYIVSFNLYHEGKSLGDFDDTAAAEAEMNAINNSKDEIYFIGGYNGSDFGIVRRLNAELRRYMSKGE